MNLYVDALGTLRLRLYALAAFEVLFKLLTVIVLAPLTAGIVSLVIATSGSAAVSNQDLINFLMSPQGVLALAVLGTLWFTLIFLELAGLVLLASAPLQEQRITFLGALLRTGRAAPRLVRLALLQFSGYVIVLTPFALAALLVYYFLLSDRDINYYLATRPPKFYTAVCIGASLAMGYGIVALLLFVRWLFSLPLVLLQHTGVFLCLRKSAHLARHFFWKVFPPVAVWFGAMFAVGLAGGWLLNMFNHAVLDQTGGQLRWIISTVAALLVLHAVASLVWSFLLFTGTSLLILQLYQRACQHADLPLVEHSKPMPDRAMTPRERWTMRGVIWLGAAVLVVLAVSSAVALVESVEVPHQVLITAHRGGSRKAPENTLAAFQAAIDMKADFAELDVQETADGEIMVIHDFDLSRVAGIKKRTWEVTSKELKTIGAGNFGPWVTTKFRTEPIPTLAAVIDLAKKGGIKLNIELKYNGHEQKLAQRVVDLLAEKEFEDQCVITSLKYAGLREIKKLNPRLKTGLIVAQAVGRLDHLHVDFLSVNANKVTRDLVQRIHAGGKQIHVWTVNGRKVAEEMMDLRVDNIITDDPELIRDAVGEWKDLSNTERLLLAFHQRLKE